MAFDIQARACIGGPATDEIQLVINNATLLELMGDLVSSNLGTNLPGVFNNCTFGLYQNGFVPDENFSFSDLTECNFTGYSRSANLTFSVAGFDDAGNVVAVADIPTPFHATADDNQTIQGCFLCTNADANIALAAGQISPALNVMNGTLYPATCTLQIGNS